MTTHEKEAPLYSIGTAARMLEVSVQMLRVYETEGLVLPRKSQGGQRRYSDADIERIACVRKAITEEKISIAGIRRMQSLIPCWQIVKCSDEQRRLCPAFHDHDGGCWTHHHLNNACADRDCRVCEVYRESTTCAGIKQLIHRSTLPQP